MRGTAWGALLTLALLGWGCGNASGQSGNPAPTAAPVASTMVETGLLPLKLTADRLAGKADIALGGGAIEAIGSRIVILDRLGSLFSYERGQVTRLDIPPAPLNIGEYRQYAKFPLNEGTLRAHDILYDPKGKLLYVSHEHFDAQAKATRFVISKIRLTEPALAAAGPWETVFRSEPLVSRYYYSGRAAGGKMLLVKDALYFALGDYSLDRITTSHADIVAQNAASSFGKIHRLDLATGRSTVVSSGHRVPQGLALTAAGEIIETEHGPHGGDELNIIKPGGNYGWPYTSLGTNYSTYRMMTPPSVKGTPAPKITPIDPLYSWVPSVAISAILQLQGFHPRWNGDLIAGSLKAQSLYRLHLREGRVVVAEPIWIGYRIRDLVQIRGQLVAWTDDGSLVFAAVEEELIRTSTLGTEPGYRVTSLNACLSCHSLTPHNQFQWAPSLAGVYGRRIGGDAFANYSPALRGRAGVWDEATLTAFLKNPESFASGTTMPDPLLDDAQLGEVIKFLKGAAAGSR